jgi:hypothetical protein
VARLTLSHVTTYLKGHLARLRAGKDVKSLIPVQVTAGDCLFETANGKTFVHLDGPGTDEAKMKELFSWKGENNVYNNFNDMLDQQPPQGNTMPEVPYKQDKWRDSFADETEAKFTRTRWFADPPGREASLTGVPPADFKTVKIDADSPRYGAEIDLLPKPSPDGTERPD